MARSCSFFFFTHARNYISRGEITAGKCGGCIHMYEGVWVYSVAGIQVLRNDRRVVFLFFFALRSSLTADILYAILR